MEIIKHRKVSWRFQSRPDLPGLTVKGSEDSSWWRYSVKEAPVFRGHVELICSSEAYLVAIEGRNRRVQLNGSSLFKILKALHANTHDIRQRTIFGNWTYTKYRDNLYLVPTE